MLIFGPPKGQAGSSQPQMPDIAKEVPPELSGRLDRVGMSNIEVPIQIRNNDGELFRMPARASAFVSLDDEKAKGIHMSRLFLMLQEELTQSPLDFALLRKLAEGFVSTHQGLSRSSLIKVSFEYPLLRPALKSTYKGWRSYPVTLMVRNQGGQFDFEIETTITYSSTCPCSAALARRLIQDGFRKSFSVAQVDTEKVYEWLGTVEGISATPHSQRSEAQLRVRGADFEKMPTVIELIDEIEAALGTPVQAAVKREDEMEFARLNAQNLMFCEDAARKIRHALDADNRIADYYAKVSHIESLHPHDAVSVVVKGVPGGYLPE